MIPTRYFTGAAVAAAIAQPAVAEAASFKVDFDVRIESLRTEGDFTTPPDPINGVEVDDVVSGSFRVEIPQDDQSVDPNLGRFVISDFTLGLPGLDILSLEASPGNVLNASLIFDQIGSLSRVALLQSREDRPDSPAIGDPFRSEEYSFLIDDDPNAFADPNVLDVNEFVAYLDGSSFIHGFITGEFFFNGLSIVRGTDTLAGFVGGVENVRATAAPLPPAALLLLAGLDGLAFVRRRAA